MFKVNLTTVRQGAVPQYLKTKTGCNPDEVADSLAALPLEERVPQRHAQIVGYCLRDDEIVRCGTERISVVDLRNGLGIINSTVFLYKVAKDDDDVSFEPVPNRHYVR